MNPSHTPGPPVPPDKHRHPATSRPIVVPLGQVGVAIVDDDENVHVLVRDILNRAQEFCWVGSYSSGEAALTGIPQSGAQLVLMDIKMPGMSGIECARRLKALLPHLIVVMITGLDDRRTISLTRECGADAFLAKPFTAGQFLATLLYCIPKSEAPEHQPTGKRGRPGDLRGQPLTDRENEFMKHLADGIPYKQIAPKMGVGYWRVHNLQHQAFKKLGAHNGIEAVRLWRQLN